MSSSSIVTPARDTKAVALRAFARHVALHPLAHYTGILSLQGLARLAVSSRDGALLELCRARLAPFVAGDVSFKCNFPNYLCGGNGAAFLFWKGLLPDVESACRRDAEQILHDAPRDPAGLVRLPGAGTDLIWIDAAFAVTPFLLFAGLAFDRRAYVDEAVRQAIGLCDVLRDTDNGLLHQSRGFAGPGKFSQDHWSRGNGWGLLALAELAAWLPEGDPHRPAVERAFVDLVYACLRYQDANGVWHQEITRPERSYAETSGTGLILFALGVAIERGLLSPAAHERFMLGLIGYARYINADGSIHNTCQGCLSPGDGSIEAYVATPPVVDDPHAFGPVILAFGQAHRLGIESIPTSANE